MKALRHLIAKEFIHLRRNRAMIAITFGMPIVQLLVLGFAISGDIEHIPAMVTDLDNSASSRNLVGRFYNTRYLDVRWDARDVREFPRDLQKGEVIISVVIPRRFERDLVRGEHPNVYIAADAQNTTVALTGVAYVRLITMSWARSLGLPRIASPDMSTSFVTIEHRIWYNPELKNVYFMIPGILVLLVTIITIMLTAMAIVRERENGTLEQLIVTPITRTELILGKTIPFAVLGIAELTFAFGVAKLVYHIPIAGSLPLFLALSFLYIFCTLGIGILVSTWVYTQQQALFTAWFIMIFCILMSGFFLPLDNMPLWVYYITYINPLRYYMTIVRELFIKGAGFAELLPQIAAVAVFALTILITAVGRFSKRLD